MSGVPLIIAHILGRWFRLLFLEFHSLGSRLILGILFGLAEESSLFRPSN